MPSHKPLKTYEKRTRQQLNKNTKSADAINALFAQNIKQRLKCRKKSKLKVKQLPPRTAEYLTDDSLKVDPNNTFDKLLKGEVYNPVNVCKLVKINSSSDATKSVSFHSPVMTRKRSSASVVVTEVSDKSQETSSLHKSSDRITSSLSIEKEKQISFPSLSYIKLPKITENEVASNTSGRSYRPFFSDTFRERHLVHSSTPALAPAQKMIADPISPITRSDSSNSSKLIEKSYDHIRKWDDNYPREDTPKRRSTRTTDSKGRRRKLMTDSPRSRDWKLQCSPKVYLRNFDRQKSSGISPEFRGFTEEEQSSSWEESDRAQSVFNSMSMDYGRAKRKFPSFKYDPRGREKITVRKKKSGRTPKLVKTRTEKASEQSTNVSKEVKSRATNHGGEKEKSTFSLRSRRTIQTTRTKSSSSQTNSKTVQRSGKRLGSEFDSSNRGGRRTELKPRKSSVSDSSNRFSRRRTNLKTRSPSVSDLSNRTSRGRITLKTRNPSVSDSSNRTSRRRTNLKNRSPSVSGSPNRISRRRTNLKTKIPSVSDSLIRTSRRRTNLTTARSSVSGSSNRASGRRATLRTRRSSVSDSPNRASRTKMNLKARNLSVSDSSNRTSGRTTNVKNRISSVSESPNRTSGRKTNLKTRSSSASQSDSSNSTKRRTRLKSISFASKRNSSKSASGRRTRSQQSPSVSGKTEPLVAITRMSLRSKTPKSTSKDDTPEMSSHSTSFDFTEETEASKPRLTVDLQEFDSFVHGYYSSSETNKSKNVSVVTVSDDSVLGKSPFKSPYPKSEPKSYSSQLDFATPLKSPHTNPNSKIIILSNISLGRSVHSRIQDDALRKINHDHSYTFTPPSKPVLQSTPHLQKPRLHSTPRTRGSLENKSSNFSDVIDTSTVGEIQFQVPKRPPLKHIILKPGKSYRRSLSLLRRSSFLVDLQKKECPNNCDCVNCVSRRKLGLEVTRYSQIVPVSRTSVRKSILETYAKNFSYVQGEDLLENLDDSVRSLALNARSSIGTGLQVTARDVVLLRCGQTEVLRFDECYPPSALQNCQKIGEGVYGEVFLYRNPNGGTSVMKIIPIEGDLIVNGERQKKFEEILSEIVISMELSNLRNNKKNTTASFSEVQKIRCLQGNYPDRLLDLWDLYDETRGSENDSPQMFPSDQMYIVLELANGGADLESFVFNNAVQAFAMFKQTACALAVAETQLKFEHRDLHWGNILVSGCDKTKTLTYRVNGKEIEVESTGVEIAIIDFTLSRIEFEGVVIFNDLSLDHELFAAKGDYQFEIYRLMQKGNGNEWQHFQPFTNVLWLHYLLDKVPALRYKNVKSKVHKEYLEKLNNFKDEILSYNSVTEFIQDFF